MKWQFQVAKAKLSEVIRRAREDGPQIITFRGTEEFVLMRRADAPQQADMGASPKAKWDGAFADVRALDVEIDLPPRHPTGARPLEDLSD